MRGPGDGLPAAATFLAPTSSLAIVVASLLDPGHYLLSDYVSWLSAGPYWWLAALGVAGLGTAALLDGLLLNRIMSGPARQAAATFLFCTAALAAANLILPSRGVGEPLWRTAAHLGLAMGAYMSLFGAAVLVVWYQRRNGFQGPGMARWLAALFVSLLVLAAASSYARLVDGGPDFRGLGQTTLMVVSTGWLAAGSRLTAPRPGMPALALPREEPMGVPANENQS